MTSGCAQLSFGGGEVVSARPVPEKERWGEGQKMDAQTNVWNKHAQTKQAANGFFVFFCCECLFSPFMCFTSLFLLFGRIGCENAEKDYFNQQMGVKIHNNNH